MDEVFETEIQKFFRMERRETIKNRVVAMEQNLRTYVIEQQLEGVTMNNHH